MPGSVRTQGTRFAVRLIIVAAVCALHAAGSADMIVFKEDAYVKGPRVMLGELAEISGENAALLASLDVAPAALPGRSKDLDGATVSSRVKKSGLAPEGMQIQGATRVRATTRHLDVLPAMIEEDLRRFILQEMPWEPEDAEIDVTVPTQAVRVPDGDVGFRWRPNPTYRYLGTGSFRGSIVVDGKVAKTFLCSAWIEAYGNVVVACNGIARGSAVTLDNATVEKRALSTMKEPFFQEPSEVVGFVTRSTVFPGRVITKRAVTPPRLIKRNQIVNVETRAGSLCILGQACALSDGIAGEAVMCTNLGSKERFQGIVRADGVVVVP